MTFDIEKMQKAVNSGTISLPTGMTHQERREFVRGELIRLQEENPCTVCEDEYGIGTITVRCRDNCCDEYIECPHCHGIGVEPEGDILTDNQLKGVR